MSRTKEIYPTREVAHLWANAENKDAPQYARNASNGRQNFWFDGPTIYSYTTPIAMRHVIGKGKRVTLMTIWSYSNTTAKHLGSVRRASSHHAWRFNVPNIGAGRAGRLNEPENWHAANVENYRARILVLVSRAEGARMRKDQYYGTAASLCKEARAYCTTFGLSVRPFPVAEAAKYNHAATACAPLMIERRRIHESKCDARTAARWAQYELRNAEHAALYRAEREASEAKRQERIATEPQRRRDWMNGIGHDTDFSGPIRLRREGAEVKTSHGASVPLDDACNLFVLLRRRRFALRLGQHVGNFRVMSVDGIDAPGEHNPPRIVIGCHTLLFSEIERFAATQEWTILASVVGTTRLAPPDVVEGVERGIVDAERHLPAMRSTGRTG